MNSAAVVFAIAAALIALVSVTRMSTSLGVVLSSVIFAASSAAYGDTPTLPKIETMQPRPLSPYAVYGPLMRPCG